MYSLRRRCWAGPRALLHALHHYALWAKVILFNLAVSTPTAKPLNLIPCQIFWLYGSLLNSNIHFNDNTVFPFWCTMGSFVSFFLALQKTLPQTSYSDVLKGEGVWKLVTGCLQPNLPYFRLGFN